MKVLSLLRFSVAVLSAVLAGCAVTPPAPDRPKLVVFLAVDGLPQRQVLAYRDQLAPDGLARFLDRGAWFAQANWGHAYTVTAAGHAAMLTGAYPHRTGIIGNDWRDPQTGAPVYNTGDTSAHYIGHKTGPLDGTSPRNLKAETVGDVLRRVDPRSKVIGISGKDRGAILPAGHAGTAYMYMGATGQFASTTYYMKDHPDWVKAFQARKTAERFFKTEWKPLLPQAAYARSLPDNQPWFGPGGGKLPMMMGVAADDVPGPAYYTALLASPFADMLALEFARAAIVGEQLGRDEAPDILAISLSGHDYVNHRWSAESRLSHDHVLQLDRMLQAFFRELDATVGQDNYLAVLTADHGFSPAPEYQRAQGLETGRINFGQAVAHINAGLSRRFGEGRWIIGSSGSSLLLDKNLLAARGLDLEAVAQEARGLLLAEPGFAAAYTRGELLAGNRSGEPLFKPLELSWHPDVSGEIQYTVKPNWVFGNTGATHGSPYRNDTHVPVMLYGPQWVKPGRVDVPVQVVDIAPTLARILRVPVPASNEGKQLPLP